MNITRISFQLMVAIGTGLAVPAAYFLWVHYRQRRLPEQRWFYAAAAAAGPGAVVAMTAGWMVTEIGRQPLVVYKVMTSAQAVTDARSVPLSYAVLVVAYVLVGVALVWILRRLAAAPLDGRDDPQSLSPAPRALAGV